jgi:hypothetical protein
VVRLLLDKVADVEVEDGNGWESLHRAHSGGHEVVVWLLLDSGRTLT